MAKNGNFCSFFFFFFFFFWLFVQESIFTFLFWIWIIDVSVLLALRLPRLGKRELILVLFVRLIDLCLFWIVGVLFLLMSGKGCGLWLWHSLDFSLTFCFLQQYWENFKTNDRAEFVEILPPSYLPYRFLHNLHSLFHGETSENIWFFF